MSYQVYTELILFVTSMISGLLPIEKNMVVMKIVGVVITFALFVVQPLCYLNGDVNFRKRVQNQGLWKALKKQIQEFSQYQCHDSQIKYKCFCMKRALSLFLLKLRFLRFLKGNPGSISDLCYWESSLIKYVFYNLKASEIVSKCQ